MNKAFRIEDGVSIRTHLDLQDTSQIFTNNREKIRQWNHLVLHRLKRANTQNLTIHICPWEDEDWQQYIVLGEQLSRLYVWITPTMSISSVHSRKITVVEFKPVDPSERFVVISGDTLVRTLISWNNTDEIGDNTFRGTLISNPTISNRILDSLNRKIALS